MSGEKKRPWFDDTTKGLMAGGALGLGGGVLGMLLAKRLPKGNVMQLNMPKAFREAMEGMENIG